MKKALSFFLFLLITSYSIPSTIHAEDKSSGTSATFIQASESHPLTEEQANRAQILRKFLETYNSPLADHAEAFVREADENNIDWKLLPAISGVESTFGLAVPVNCNNAWGYNIYGNMTRCFDTYDRAIAIISHDLRHLYMDQWGATDIYSIGHMYAASPTWAYRVSNYMEQLGNYALDTQSPPLPITL